MYLKLNTHLSLNKAASLDVGQTTQIGLISLATIVTSKEREKHKGTHEELLK